MTATVSATPHDKILKADPLVKMAYRSFHDRLGLASYQKLLEGNQALPRLLDEKVLLRGNIIVVADKNELVHGNPSPGHQYVAIKFPTSLLCYFYLIPTIWDMSISGQRTNVITSKDVEAVIRKPVTRRIRMANSTTDSYGPDEYTEHNRSRTYAGLP